MKNKRFSLCVVGASNVDIHVRVQEELQKDTSTIGEVYLTSGGVGRNIVDGLAGLKICVSFISAFSDDIFSDMLLMELRNEYISLKNSLFHTGQTLKYVDIMTARTAYGVNDIRNINELTVSFFQQKLYFLCNMTYVIIDLNINADAVDFLMQNVNTRLICEATSTIKCTKISKALDKLYILKANYKEACIIAGCTQNVRYDELLDILLGKGIEKVYITLGAGGALYADKDIKLYARNQKVLKGSDALGAGDAFMAGIMYGEIRCWSQEKTLIFCEKLCYGYLSSGKHRINSEIEQYALNPNNDVADLLFWDTKRAQWIGIRKALGILSVCGFGIVIVSGGFLALITWERAAITDKRSPADTTASLTLKACTYIVAYMAEATVSVTNDEFVAYVQFLYRGICGCRSYREC